MMKNVLNVLFLLNAVVVLICLLNSIYQILSGQVLMAIYSMLLAINSTVWFGILLFVLRE